ncbi:MAG: acyloxyacyl hydrolase [Acidobacteriota bacterium]
MEFRSGIDVRYRFEKKGALALGFYHLSNASISSTNPGTNSLLLRIELP